jgi:DNA-binding GntR family transcriptional regulator
MPAKELAYRHIRDEALYGEGGLGTRFLTEEALASELGVSRTPVREALLRLEAEGILELVPNKGAMVPSITERDVNEVMEVRQMLEKWGAGWACENEGARDHLVARLTEMNDEMSELGSKSAIAEFIDCDREFHGQVVYVTGNRLARQIYGRLRDQQIRMGIHAVLAGRERIDSVCEEHARIIRAFEGGDAEKACAAIDDHIVATAEILYQRIAAEQ